LGYSIVCHTAVVIEAAPVAPLPHSLAGGSIDAVVERFGRPALALARRIVVDDGLAEDVVQEVLTAVWRHPAAFDPTRGSFSAWLMAVVHHKAVDVVRREQAAGRRLAPAHHEHADDREEMAPDAAEQVCDRDAGARVRTALAALPPTQREPLVLAYWGGYTQREIAARTGAPIGTVKSRMFIGMQRLHHQLGDDVRARELEKADRRTAAAP
jgi:RNA polymerase sigma factor (sigma-70 family)